MSEAPGRWPGQLTHVVPLHAGNPGAMTGAGNWTYLLPGRHPVLIDAGVGEASHLAAIEHVRREGPGHVLVSHAHVDHVSGAPAIAARWSDTRFSKVPWPERDASTVVAWNAIGDDEIIAAGDDELRAIHTPGHAPDHVAFWHEASRTLFSGDLVVAGSTVVIPASTGGSLTAYMRSLGRVLALAPSRLLPAHGSPIDNPEQVLQQYLAHRQQREQQVLAALREGARTIGALVSRIYIGLNPALVPMAHESVLAHLRKLENDGAVIQAGDGWTLQ